jgi:hypothetical protein
MAFTLETSGAAAVTIDGGTAEAARNNAYDTVLRQRLVQIGLVVASAVILEDTGTANHTSRVNYARQFVANPVVAVNNSVSFLVCADGATGTASSDQDIANRLGDVWNVLSQGY